MTMINLVLMVYPERRRVPEATILKWAKDEHANGCDYWKCRACGQITSVDNGCPHAYADPVHEDGAEPPTTIEDAMLLLEDMGACSFMRDAPAFDGFSEYRGEEIES